MARTLAELPKGARITDFVSLGVLTEKFPRTTIDRILQETGRASKRERNLPAHVVVYYVIALALYGQVSYGEVLRCLLEGLEWLGLNVRRLRGTAKSAITQARSRLGKEPLQRLYQEVVSPIATPQTQGAWYRGRRLVTLDGSTLDLADTAANEATFGRPGASRGRSGYPQLRFVALLENGTHVLFATEMGGYGRGESTLAHGVVAELGPEMVCLADRNFFSYALWKRSQEGGSHLLWRVKKNLRLPCLERLSDGSYRSKIYPNDKARRRDQEGLAVRVIEYRLEGIDERYRLLTTLQPEDGPAEELAALYHERWEIETALDELKTHLRGARIVLRSKKPELVEQEFYGLLLAHFALRGLMHEAALKAHVDPDKLSFVHSLRVVRRKLPRLVSIPPSGENCLS